MGWSLSLIDGIRARIDAAGGGDTPADAAAVIADVVAATPPPADQPAADDAPAPPSDAEKISEAARQAIEGAEDVGPSTTIPPKDDPWHSRGTPADEPQFEPSATTASKLDPANPNLTDGERAVAEQFQRLVDTEAGAPIAEQLRADDVEIVLTDDDEVYASYGGEPPQVTINLTILDEPDQLLKVLAHEGRHHQQHALGVDDSLNAQVGEGSGEGSDLSDGVEADATFYAVRVAQELGISLNSDEQQALNPDGSERSLQELVNIRRAQRRIDEAREIAQKAGEAADLLAGAEGAKVAPSGAWIGGLSAVAGVSAGLLPGK